MNIYIESEIKGPRRRDGRAGYVMECEGKTLTQFGTVENANENEACIKALRNALGRLKINCDIVIWTDSLFIRNAYSLGWIEKWETNDWKNAKGEEVECKEEWLEISKKAKNPEVIVGEEHVYKSWLQTELGRRSKIAETQ